MNGIFSPRKNFFHQWWIIYTGCDLSLKLLINLQSCICVEQLERSFWRHGKILLWFTVIIVVLFVISVIALEAHVETLTSHLSTWHFRKNYTNDRDIFTTKIYDEVFCEIILRLIKIYIIDVCVWQGLEDVFDRYCFKSFQT